MKTCQYLYLYLGLTSLLLIFGSAGCQTGGNDVTRLSGNIKTRGVYTTVALPPELDLQASGYLSKSSFGPNETPAAVVVGYGEYNQQQLLSLEVIELSTGRSLFSKDYYASFGKVLMQPLSIRLSGNYKVRLLSRDKEWDACNFTVIRTNGSGTASIDSANFGASYGKGVFDVEVLYDQHTSYFDKYDERLIYHLLNAVTKDTEDAHRELFAQRFPGKVVFQCRLDITGYITEPKIRENTLDEECGQVFQEVLLKRSPYGAWPEDASQKLGSTYRDLTLTISFE